MAVLQTCHEPLQSGCPHGDGPSRGAGSRDVAHKSHRRPGGSLAEWPEGRQKQVRGQRTEHGVVSRGRQRRTVRTGWPAHSHQSRVGLGDSEIQITVQRGWKRGREEGRGARAPLHDPPELMTGSRVTARPGRRCSGRADAGQHWCRDGLGSEGQGAGGDSQTLGSFFQRKREQERPRSESGLKETGLSHSHWAAACAAGEGVYYRAHWGWWLGVGGPRSSREHFLRQRPARGPRRAGTGRHTPLGSRLRLSSRAAGASWVERSKAAARPLRPTSPGCPSRRPRRPAVPPP